MVRTTPGSVFYRHDTGKWIARRRFVDGTGKQREKSFTCKSEDEAWKKLAEVHKLIIKGGKLEAREMKLSQWLHTALEEIYKPKLRGNTYALYKNFAENHAIGLGHIPLNKLTVDMLDHLINSRTTLGSRSKAHFRRFLIGALNHAVRKGKLAANPAAKTQLHEQPKSRRVKALTKDQALRLLAETHNPMFKAIFACQLSLGLRIGEALGMQWADIVEQQLTVRQQLQRDRSTGKHVLQNLKTEKSVRSIGLPTTLYRLLMDLPRQNEMVFCTKKGTSFSYRNVQRALDAAATRAKLGKVSTHVLRHTYATLSVSARVPLNVIRDAMGHTDIRTTLIYAESDIEPIREANDLVAAMILPA